MEEKQELSKGQKRVGVNFNPSENDDVAWMKNMSAALIDKLESMRPDGGNGEKHRAISEAQTQIETGCMWAVKSIFID